MIQNTTLLVAQKLFAKTDLIDLLSEKIKIKPDMLDEQAFIFAFAAGSEYAVTALLYLLSNLDNKEEIYKVMDPTLEKLHDMACPKCSLTEKEIADGAIAKVDEIVTGFHGVFMDHYSGKSGGGLPPALLALLGALLGGEGIDPFSDLNPTAPGSKEEN